MATKRPAEAAAAEAPSKASKGNLNQEFCDFLIQLAEFEKNVVRNIHKSNVYRKAARALAQHDKRISSGTEAKKLEGIGAKIGAKIDEYIATGGLKKLDKIQHDPTAQAIQLLTSVVGIGPVAAHEFVKRGITTIDQLRAEKGLNHTQLVGLKYYDEIAQRIPRAEMDVLKAEAFRYIGEVFPGAKMEACGSYRRGAASSGDIDVLMTVDGFSSHKKDSHNHVLETVVEHMKKKGFITDVLSCGSSKFMGICVAPDGVIHRRIDIRLWPSDQFVAGLLYFTGSDETNKNMRRRGIETGFHLNEYGICPVGETGVHGEPLPVATEKDIFEYLGMDYLAPENR